MAIKQRAGNKKASRAAPDTAVPRSALSRSTPSAPANKLYLGRFHTPSFLPAFFFPPQYAAVRCSKALVKYEMRYKQCVFLVFYCIF